MKCPAFTLILNEAIAYKVYLKHEAELTRKNIIALKSAKMEIEAILKSVI